MKSSRHSGCSLLATHSPFFGRHSSTCDRAVEIGIQKLSDSEVHVQRKDWNAGTSNTERLVDDQDGDGPVEEFVEDFTRVEYRLSKAQLRDLVQRVDHPSELTEYIRDHGIQAVSSFQDTLRSGFGGATRGMKAGSTLGSLAGPAGSVAGGLMGIPLGYFLAKNFGEEFAGWVQQQVRDRLGLGTDQEFDTQEETASQASAGTKRGE